MAKIKSIQGNGTWEGQHGLMYSFEVEMVDGKVYQANAKNSTPPYAVGDEVEVTVKGEKNGKVNASIKKSDGNYPASGDDHRQKLIVRQSCLNRATDVFPSGSKEQHIELAEYYFNWVMTGDK
jgi:hypothetical protein